MAIAKVQKIQLIGIQQYKEKILDILQEAGTIQITTQKTKESKAQYTIPEKLQKIELDFANVEYAIKLLSKYEAKKSLFAGPITLTADEVKEKTKNFNSHKVIEACLEAEDKIVKAEGNLAFIQQEQNNLSPWKSLHIPLEHFSGTKQTNILLVSVKKMLFQELEEALKQVKSSIHIQIIFENENNIYLSIIFLKEKEKEIRQLFNEYKCEEAEMPKKTGLLAEYLKQLEKNADENKQVLQKIESELKELSLQLDNMKIAHDYISWEKEKLEKTLDLESTAHNFILQGWIPRRNMKKIEASIEKETNEFMISEIEPEENEAPPVIIQNSNFISPFESVLKIYGLPLANELDPTVYLAPFFIIFFGLCLTDAGYGLVIVILMALALKYLKLPEGTKKMAKLLMYGGAVTFIIGALFGGWFSLTPDQVPEFLTKTNANGQKLFIFQKIDALKDPIKVLILSFTLGFTQIVLGIYMKLFHGMKEDKKEALLDTGPWAFILTGIGFFVLTKTGIVPESLMQIAKWWIIIGVGAIILTQGRSKKNVIGKLLSGILSLYGMVGYISDVLSYSRLLALGLATTIIGLAVNTIASLVNDMIPYVGWILMIVVFIGGHIFNLLINALGSFIHSGRLQFVEFFTKFMEGGGDEFKPLNKKCKYIFIKSSINL